MQQQGYLDEVASGGENFAALGGALLTYFCGAHAAGCFRGRQRAPRLLQASEAVRCEIAKEQCRSRFRDAEISV